MINNETLNFLNLYKKETNQSEEWINERLKEIENKGLFSPTTDELTFGAQVAWRNSNKCIGRLFWKTLNVFDERHLTDEHAIFDAVVRHVKFATNFGKILPTLTVFEMKRVRFWNHQIIRYAGYETANGVIGDSDSIAFTKKCMELGWKGEGTHFDVLPIVIQVDERPPVLFELPKEEVLEVELEHPEYPNFKELGLKWYAVPIISSMKFSIGEIDYGACPFNGWYMGTEIGARNLGDSYRYNQCEAVAKLIGLDTSSSATLWRDRALVELNIAVLHSFKREKVTIVDHHTASQQFKLFQQQEAENNRPVTGNWVWLVPPISGSSSHIFHEPIHNEINRPNYFYQPVAYRVEHETEKK